MAVECSNCRADSVPFRVPESLRDHRAVNGDWATICRVCLTVDELDTEPTAEESLHAVSEAFPSDPPAAAGIAVLLGLLESLALNRPDIEAVVEHLESEHGVDPMLVLDRLADDPDLSPAIALDRRRHQLEQLL